MVDRTFFAALNESTEVRSWVILIPSFELGTIKNSFFLFFLVLEDDAGRFLGDSVKTVQSFEFK